MLEFKDRNAVTHYFFNGGGGDTCSTTKAGTRAHAAAVVRRIDRFCRLNEAALKARRLPVVRDNDVIDGEYR